MRIIQSIREFVEAIRLGLCKLNEMQFSAPWNPQRTFCKGSGL